MTQDILIVTAAMAPRRGPERHASRARPTLKSADTRMRIVRGALQALERYGLGEATTRRIAAESGVRLATLHYHFESKDAVLLAVLDVIVTELAGELAATTRASATLDARIADAIEASWAYVETTRAKQIVQYELTLYALRTRGAEWLAVRQYRAYVEAYAALLRDPSLSPMINDEQADDLARLLLAGIDGLILQALAGAENTHLRAGLEALTIGVQARARRLMRQTRGNAASAPTTRNPLDTDLAPETDQGTGAGNPVHA